MISSRIPLLARHSRQHPYREICAGWDPPLATFFGYVLDDDDAIIDVGNRYNDELNPYRVADLLVPYAHLPADFVETLTVHRAVEQLDRAQPHTTQVIDPAVAPMNPHAIDFVVLHPDGRLEALQRSQCGPLRNVLARHVSDPTRNRYHAFTATAADLFTPDMPHNWLADYLIAGLGYYHRGGGWAGTVVLSHGTDDTEPLPPSIVAKIEALARLGATLDRRPAGPIDLGSQPVKHTITALTELREVEPDYLAYSDVAVPVADLSGLGATPASDHDLHIAAQDAAGPEPAF